MLTGVTLPMMDANLEKKPQLVLRMFMNRRCFNQQAIENFILIHTMATENEDKIDFFSRCIENPNHFI